MTTNRRRVKISANVIDDALRLWAERQQERAVERQLREDASRSGECAVWQSVREAAARRHG
jgi:hypothetical protein